jgi:hypothetical protein
MAFPYLIKVVSSGEPKLLLEVVVVTAETEWRRYFASGEQESSFSKAKEYRAMFANKRRAMDILGGGMSEREIEFKEDAPQKDIDNALKELKEQKPKK